MCGAHMLRAGSGTLQRPHPDHAETTGSGILRRLRPPSRGPIATHRAVKRPAPSRAEEQRGAAARDTKSAGLTGYLHPAYAESLTEFGTPRELPRSGGQVLERAIGRTGLRDALGCYPLFCCRQWGALAEDLAVLSADGLVSVTCVVDPFGGHTPDLLERTFDRVTTFKDHHVTDLRSDGRIGARRHRDYARQSLRKLTVERAPDPSLHLDEWVEAYDTLIRRHGLTGIHAFSRASFARQLAVPGMVMFRALHEGRMVGAQLWFLQGDVAYNHLQASTDEGYEHRVAYALAATAIEGLADEVRWLDFGGGAGASGRNDDGLSAFKRGWATGVRPAYLCGRTLDAERYAKLAAQRELSEASYYPAYRTGEFR